MRLWLKSTGKSHKIIVYKSITMPQSEVVIIFLSTAEYDANLPSHHTNVVQLARGLETPSQCLLCERLFKLNWYFCDTALSERSGRRIAEALRRRKAHCGQSVSKVRWLVSKAIVTPNMPQWRYRVAEWNRSERGQRSLFCVHALVCVFVCVSLCCVLCLFVEIQPTQAFHSPGISSLPSQERDWQREGWTMWTPPLCPYCAHVAASIVL